MKAQPDVPPKDPNFVILPSFQKNGANVGTPVVGFGVEVVYEHPATCPPSLILAAKASGPPSVFADRLTFGRGIVSSTRYISALVEGMREAGLVIA